MEVSGAGNQLELHPSPVPSVRAVNHLDKSGRIPRFDHANASADRVNLYLASFGKPEECSSMPRATFAP